MQSNVQRGEWNYSINGTIRLIIDKRVPTGSAEKWKIEDLLCCLNRLSYGAYGQQDVPWYISKQTSSR